MNHDKNDLTCGVAQDLLPSYIEGLLCQESQQAVDRHLSDCPDCAAALATMRAAESAPDVEKAAQSREVDYLKRVKKRNRWTIASAVVCTGLVMVGAFLFQIFERGVPLNPQTIGVTKLSYTEESPHGDDGILSLSLTSSNSGNAFHSWRIATADDSEVAYITAREVLVSPLHSSGGKSMELSMEGLRELWLGSPSGRLLWQDGMTISPLNYALMDARTPYCGDPTALEHIAEILRLSLQFGRYTISMQTSEHPYGWTLEFANRPGGEQRRLANYYNILALTLVDNLEVSRCTYPAQDEPGSTETDNDSMVLEDVNQTILPRMVKEYNAAHGTDWEPKSSIKDYALSPADLQRLLLILDSFYGLTFVTRTDG